MKELIFVLKVFLITLVVVIFMQIKVGTLTLEERASVLIQDSWLTGEVQTVGDGLQKILGDVTGTLGKKLGSIFRKEEINERANYFKLERSPAYQKERETEAKSASNR